MFSRFCRFVWFTGSKGPGFAVPGGELDGSRRKWKPTSAEAALIVATGGPMPMMFVRRLRVLPNPVKPEAAEIELIDKNIDHPNRYPNRIVVTDPLFQLIGKQSALLAVRALDKTLHRILPPKHRRTIARSTFLCGLGQERSCRGTVRQSLLMGAQQA